MTPAPIAVRVHEAARPLGLTEPAVRHLIAKKQIDVLRYGDRVFIEMDAINGILRSKLTAK